MTNASRPMSTLISVTIHLMALALLLSISSTVQHMPEKMIRDTRLLSPFLPKVVKQLRGLGGGGGARQSVPATVGRLPEVTRRQFVPPTIEVINPAPKLAMAMSIEAPPDAMLPDVKMVNLGNPLSKIVGASGGRGGPGGIGAGDGPGVGDHSGASIGSGGAEGQVYRGGAKGVTLPVVIYKVDPEFSEEARKSHYSGSVLILAEVDASGKPRNLRVARSVGMGLDEKALEAVSKWRFKPGTKDGKAVAVAAVIEVSFHLL